MKTTQILFLVLFAGLIFCVVTYTHLLDPIKKKEGFENASLPVNKVSEPTIASSIMPTRISLQAMPNSSVPGTLPFGPYAQTASVGSYQYQDPSQLPAELKQMKQLNEDLRSFLVFEGASVSNSSDPTVQLPLTQLRADSRKLQQEITVLEVNPGVQSSLTQQGIADIQEALTFLQKKVRLFQTAGVVSGGAEGFQDVAAKVKTRATKENLQELQTRVYGSILTLSASGTVDPVVQSRIKRLQEMYSAVNDMISKLDKGIWTSADVPVFKEDIEEILPKLVKPTEEVKDIFSQQQGSKPTSPLENHIAGLVGTEAASGVIKNLMNNGSLRFNVELGFGGTKNSKSYDLLGSGDKKCGDAQANAQASALETNSPYDSKMPGVDDRYEAKNKKSKLGGLDWKKRSESICEQVRLRGLDPQDFGCLAKDSMMSPAYSWRGHTKMICGRLASTMDPNLPVVSGCPPSNWRGWTLS
jgi:hypothetical protein